MSENQRIIGSFKKETISKKLRNNHLLVIGIDTYSNGIPPLNNAVRDAKAFRDILIQDFQFEEKRVTTLFDKQATKKNLLATFDSLLESLTDLDSLVVYFSGHGELHEATDRGYWIPVDAVNGDRSTFLSNSEVVDFFKFCKAHHIFSIVDSCFSGSLFESKRGNSVQERLDNIPSRWLLTAGRKEPVSDGALGKNSPFATSLLVQLKNNEENALWCSDLCNRVLRAVEFNVQEQTPRGEPLQNVGHHGGQFVFYKKGFSPKKEATQITEKQSSAQQTTRSIEPKKPLPKSLPELKEALKLMAAEDLEAALEQANEILLPTARVYNNMILLRSRLTGLLKQEEKGRVKFEQAENIKNGIVDTFARNVDSIKMESLRPESLSGTTSNPGTFNENQKDTVLSELENLEDEGLKQQAILLQRKLNLIRKKMPLEDDPTRYLNLEVEKEETEKALLEIKKQLEG